MAHPAMGFGSNFLVLGREVTLPVDIMYGLPPDVEELSGGGFPSIILMAYKKLG